MRLKLLVATAMVTLTAGSWAGQYKLRPPAGSFKNPSGGTIQYTGGTEPYAGSSGSYGAGEEYDPDSVLCQGTITTIWDWEPDQIPHPTIPNVTIPDPLDVPPKHVIIHERCSATFEGMFFATGAADGDCDNGLGFTPVESNEPIYLQGEPPLLIGYSFTGSSAGTRYKRVNGSATITVQCSPSVLVMVSDGLCSAEVEYAVQLINPQVNLVGTTDFSTPRSIKFLTGQQISATVSLIRSPNNLIIEQQPLGIAQTGFSWLLAKSWDPFKAYDWFPVGERKELLTPDLAAAQLSFYTNDKGEDNLTCDFLVTQPQDALFAGGLPNVSVDSKSLESVRPQFMKWTIKTGEVFQFGNPPFQFGFGPSTTSTQGQEWSSVEYYVPGGFPQEGTGCFAQLINAKRDLWRTVTNQGAFTHFIKNPFDGVTTLDGSFPYPNGTVWSLPAKGMGYDSPSQPLSCNTGDSYTLQWTRSKAIDSLKTWVMFRPPANGSQNTTWVPMASYEWSWHGDANYVSGSWVLSPKGSQVGNVDDAERKHPVWQYVTPHGPNGFGFIGVP